MKDTTLASTHVIRMARQRDFPALRFVDPLMQADRDREHLVRTSIDRGECFVVVDDDDVQGFVILNYALFGHAFVPLLVVAASDRRRGLATALLDESTAAPLEQRRGIGLMLALRRWEPESFKRLRRTPSSAPGKK